MRHRARRRFGQNFLVDAAVIARIVEAIEPRPGELLVEIGPGRAALTGPLLEAGVELVAIELDRDLAGALQAGFGAVGRFRLHAGDALDADLRALTGERPYRLVGNLPYNVSTPLLFHFLGQAHLPQDMHFMLQREVVSRMAAPPGAGDYGRLSVMCQNLCRVAALFDIAPEAFRPRPGVVSTFVRLTPRAEPISGRALLHRLDRVVRAAFSMRRKTLRNSLRRLLDEAQIRAAGVDPGLRAEQLSIEAFIGLAKRIE